MTKPKQKGNRGEHEVRIILQEAMDEVCAEGGWAKVVIERNLEQTRFRIGREVRGGSGGGSDLIGLPWFAIEVKYRENDSGWQAWWEQTKRAAWVDDPNGAEAWNDGRKGYYAREPVLFSRKNWAPWEIWMFGYLVVNEGLRIRIPVDVNLPNFLGYFKYKCAVEMRGLESEGELKSVLGGSSLTNPPNNWGNMPQSASPNLGETPQSPGENLPNSSSRWGKSPQFDGKTGKKLSNLGQNAPTDLDELEAPERSLPEPPRFRPPWEKP